MTKKPYARKMLARISLFFSTYMHTAKPLLHRGKQKLLCSTCCSQNHRYFVDLSLRSELSSDYFMVVLSIIQIMVYCKIIVNLITL